jgi:hypothetical protein
LKGEHHSGHIFNLNVVAVADLADGVVLAVNAGHVAVREENRARTSDPRDRRLFTDVKAVARNLEACTCPAESDLACEPVYPAPPRAKPAIFQMRLEKLDLFWPHGLTKTSRKSCTFIPESMPHLA